MLSRVLTDFPFFPSTVFLPNKQQIEVSTRPRNSLVPKADVTVYPQRIAESALRLTNLTYLSGVVSDKVAAENAKLQAEAAVLRAKAGGKLGGNATALPAAEAAKRAAKDNVHSNKKKNDTSFAASVSLGGGDDWTVGSNLPAQLGAAQGKKQEIDDALLNAAVVAANEAEALAQFAKGNGGGKKKRSLLSSGGLPYSSPSDLVKLQGASLKYSSPELDLMASLTKLVPGHFLSTFQLLGACSAGAVAPPPWLSADRDDVLIDGEPVSQVVLKDLTRPPLLAPLDPLGLAPEFTGKTCKATIYCVPGTFISTADSGCQPTTPGTKFLFVVDDASSATGKVSTSLLQCPAAGSPPLLPALIEVSFFFFLFCSLSLSFPLPSALSSLPLPSSLSSLPLPSLSLSLPLPSLSLSLPLPSLSSLLLHPFHR